MLPAALTPLPMLVDDPARASLAAEGHRRARQEVVFEPWVWREGRCRYEVYEIPAGHPGVNELDHEAEPCTPAEVLVHPPLVKAAKER